MNEVALKKQIENLETELKVLEDYLKTEIMNLRADTEQLKLEVTACRRVLEQKLPDFREKYLERFSQEVREGDPEAR